ncbi:hypothetical protein HZA39_02600 [Candidatus Peregrinibacteria bacterium]|nr:hypothetical protein [Candidatus Peregrinibacteria bacterium]
MPQAQVTQSLLKQHYYSKYINIYTVVLILAAILLGFFVVDRYKDYSYKSFVISNVRTSIEELQKDKDKMAAEGAEIDKNYTENMRKINETLAEIFPTAENYTGVIKVFDEYFKRIDTTNNPAMLPSVKFDNVAKSKTGDYSVLPFTVTIDATKANFDNFLKYVYESGDINKENRLFEIKSFSLNIPDSKTKKTLTLNVKMETYLQTRR